MKSKRKFLSIFAILFALVFALSVCFFAACGNKDDDEKDNDTTTEQDENTGSTGDDEGGDGGSSGGTEGGESGSGETATVTGVTVTPTELPLEIGGTETGTLTASVAMSDSSPYAGNYTWKSDDEDIATVEGDGATATVTAVAEGETTITVTAGGVSGECAVSVTIYDPYTEVSSDTELSAALEANAEYIRLADAITVTSTVEITGTVTLDLNGKSITSAGTTIGVASGGSLTVTDSAYTAESNNGIVSTYTNTNDANGNSTSQYYAGAIATTGTLVIESGNVISSSMGILAEGGETTISGGKVTSDYFSIFEGAGEVVVNIIGGTISGTRKGIAVCGDSAFGYWDNGTKQYQDNAKTTLNVSGGSVTCQDDSPICTLGEANYDSAVINIIGGEIYRGDTTDGTPMPAIYAPSTTLTISGGKITGPTAVEVRGGHATVTGGDLISNATGTASENANSGAKTYGYSLAVYPYGKVTRNGAHTDSSITDTKETENEVVVSVSGGAFAGAVYKAETSERANWSYADTYSVSITGGIFTENPSSCLSGGYTTVSYSSAAIASAWKVVASNLVAELDMEDGRFTADTTIVAEGAENGAAVNYNGSASTATGFTATSNSSGKKIIVDTQSTSDGVAHTVLSFNGTGRCDRNSVSYTFTEAGTYDIVLSYFNGNSGRYATVLTGTGSGTEVGTVQEEEKTDGETKVIITRTVQITVEADTTIYIGSQNSGLYVTYIGIFTAATV